jgi:hypothetical protein
VKSETPFPAEKVKFPIPPEPEKVKSEPAKPLERLEKAVAKVVDTKERKDKEDMPASQVPEQAERLSPYWCDAHGFCHSQPIDDHCPDCRLKR